MHLDSFFVNEYGENKEWRGEFYPEDPSVVMETWTDSRL